MAKNHSSVVYTDDPKDWAEYLRESTQQEIDELCQGIAQAERDGLFGEMFTCQCRQVAELPTKELLLQSIRPDMKLYKSTFLRIFGFEISYHGFADIALSKLEEVGCQRAREYYEQFTTEYGASQAAKIEPVAAWFREEIDRQYEKGCGELRKLQERTKLSKETVATEILKW